MPPKRPTLRIVAAGMPGIDLDIINFVGKNYGISYELVGGCTETEAFMDSIHRYNQTTDSIVSQEFGLNWEKQFNIEVDSINSLIKKAEKIIKTQTEYNQQIVKYADSNKTVGLWIEPTETEYIFLAQAYIYQSAEQSITKNVFKEWKVDTKNWKILNNP